MVPPLRGGRLAHHRVPVAAAAALPVVAVGLVTAATFSLGRSWHDPVFIMPGAVPIVAAACTAAFAAGAVLAWIRHDPGPWLTALATSLFVWGVLTMFSIGLDLVVLGVAVVLLRVHRSGQRRARRGWPVPAGVLLSLGLVPLSLFVLARPVVQCVPGGVSAALPVWALRSTSGQSGGSSTPGGAFQGSVAYGGGGYSYTCDGGHLVHFMAH